MRLLIRNFAKRQPRTSRDHTWRRLYRIEEGSFAHLPWPTRGLAALLLKICDEDGYIECGDMSPWTAVGRLLGESRIERTRMKRHIEALIEEGYITVHDEKVIANRSPSDREVIANRSPSDREVIANRSPADAQPAEIIEPETHKKEKKREEKNREEAALAADVITYLNQQAGKSYESDNNAHQKHIIGRLRERRSLTLDDFRRVIDSRVALWKADAKMSQYLRPATLFNGEKFWVYLDEAKAAAAPRRSAPSTPKWVDPAQGVVDKVNADEAKALIAEAARKITGGFK